MSGINRREFLGAAALGAGGLLAGVRPAAGGVDPGLAGGAMPAAGLAGAVLAGGQAQPRFRISLAAWSLHKMFFAKEVDQLGMVRMCRDEFGIDGFEMVNTMWPSPTYNYCQQLMKLADEKNVKLLLIMCDAEGDMSHPQKKDRLQAARNHHKWVDVAAVLGCHSIRCNTGSGRKGDMEAVKRAAESFSALVEYGKANGVKIIIENHGGFSSDPPSLIALMEAVGQREHFGTLPDFGNFPADVDKYDAIRQMMPYAHAVSAKCYDFDDDTGLETQIDFPRMMKIVTDAGYNGFVGIEFEGGRLDEVTGIKRANALLEKLATQA
jgi:L-ribulose-5-phosphate 3-epimerase